MLTTSKNANPNYLCKVVALKGLKKHGNADRLQTVTIDFNTVITGLDAKDGDVYVYFPVEGKISKEFLSFTNSFRDSSLNTKPSEVGFFEDNCRVKAMKLRGEKSMGYIVPARLVEQWASLDGAIVDYVGQEFDTINGKLLVEKYEVARKAGREDKQGKTPKLSRLVEGQVRLHVDTENLRKNAHKIKPEDTVSITYKTHGTSWWVSNVLVKRKLSFLERLLRKLGVSVNEFEFDLVYGSRRVVKNKDFEDPKGKDHYFGYDLWEDIKNIVGEHIPKGWTLYGEMLGYDRNGKEIQKGYDYGCDPEGGGTLNNPNRIIKSFKPQHKLEVYRITNTTVDGQVTELSYPEIKEFCDRVGLDAPVLFYYGKVGSLYATEEYLGQTLPFDETKFVTALEKVYNEKDCFMCTNKVPEEGIVVRKESLFNCESYKLKSFRFLEWESKELDKGESDTESEN